MQINQTILDAVAANPDAKLISTNEARAILREAFRDRQHWLFVVDARGFELVERIINTHYAATDDPAAARAVAFPALGRMFSIVALRKAEMSARQLQRHLQTIGIHLNRRDVAEKDVLVATDARWNDIAAGLADEILSDQTARKVTYRQPVPGIYGCPN